MFVWRYCNIRLVVGAAAFTPTPTAARAALLWPSQHRWPPASTLLSTPGVPMGSGRYPYPNNAPIELAYPGCSLAACPSDRHVLAVDNYTCSLFVSWKCQAPFDANCERRAGGVWGALAISVQGVGARVDSDTAPCSSRGRARHPSTPTVSARRTLDPVPLLPGYKGSHGCEWATGGQRDAGTLGGGRTPPPAKPFHPLSPSERLSRRLELLHRPSPLAPQPPGHAPTGPISTSPTRCCPSARWAGRRRTRRACPSSRC